jgi:H+-transporting ATPase
MTEKPPSSEFSEVTIEKHKPNQDLPAVQQLTVEELYDKDKYDLSTMEPGDVFVLLQ